MKTITRVVTERFGELLGPIDWNYDFDQHDWDHGGGVNPHFIKSGIEHLKQLTDGKEYQVLVYGNWHDVLEVGMWDGDPYWKPTPSVCIHTWLGAEWHCFYNIISIKAKII